MTLRQNLSRYLYAGFPILYINTFEEGTAEGGCVGGCRLTYCL